MEKSLAAALNEKSSLKSYLDQQTKDTTEKEVMFKNRLAQDINDERDKTARVIAEQRIQLEAERERLRNEYAVESKTLQNRAVALGKYRQGTVLQGGQKSHYFNVSLEKKRNNSIYM